MIRYLGLACLLFLAGCGSSVLPESADAKAIREYFRETRGDGVKVNVSNVRSSGPSKNYLVKFAGDTAWSNCGEDGIAVIANISAPSTPLATKGDSLFIVSNGKVVAQYGMFKKKN